MPADAKSFDACKPAEPPPTTRAFRAIGTEAGYTPDKIKKEYPQLSLIQIYAALVYYHDHKANIEACFPESEKWAEENERERAEYLGRRSR